MAVHVRYKSLYIIYRPLQNKNFKTPIEIVLRGLLFVFFKFYIGFHGFHLKKLKIFQHDF